MELLTTKYQKKISGVLSCFDRVIITGTIPQICYSQGMTSYLYGNNIRILIIPNLQNLSEMRYAIMQNK